MPAPNTAGQRITRWRDPRDPRVALAAAGLSLALLVATGVSALLLAPAHRSDVVALGDFSLFDRPPLAGPATIAVQAFNSAPYAVLIALLLLAALLQRRPRKAVAALVVLIAAPATSETLKPLLATTAGLHAGPGLHLGGGSWPSGHATTSMIFVLCAVFIAPQQLRALVAAAGAALATLVAYSILMLSWHFPSDVLGGQLVAGCWALLAIAALGACQKRWPERARGGPVPASNIRLGPRQLLGTLLAAAAAILANPQFPTRLLAGHAIFILAAATIGLLAITLPSLIARTAPHTS